MCAGECLEAVSSELSFFTLPNCFELFGFDLMVDEDWHLWLLEVQVLLQMLQALCTASDPSCAQGVSSLVRGTLPKAVSLTTSACCGSALRHEHDNAGKCRA